MAKKSSSKRSKKGVILVLILVVILAVAGGYVDGGKFFKELIYDLSYQDIVTPPTKPQETPNNIVTSDETMNIYFLDVGQADSTIFQVSGKTMVIDTGNSGDDDIVIDKLKELGVSKIDVLIGTHAHEDHMGSFLKIVKAFDIGVIYTPNNEEDNITTKYYLDFENYMYDQDIEWKYIEPKNVGDVISLGNAKLKFLAPMTMNNSERNNDSIVVMVEFEGSKILMMGDSEKASEKLILESGNDVDADLLKVGHHGSDTSSSKEFIEAVSPKYAVIMVQTGNTYNLPKLETMNLLKENRITVFRTDENGEIKFIVDEGTITTTSTAASYSGY